MSRSLTAAAVRAVLAQETDAVFLELLTISHPDIATVRVVNNTLPITSRGNVYDGFPFSLRLPQDVAERLGTVQLTVNNVDRRLVEAIRSVPAPLTVSIEVVTAATPDLVEVGPFDCELFDVTGTMTTISGTLGFEPVLNRVFPAGKFDPQRFPGLFGKSQ